VVAAETAGATLTLIDTAGRLHTSTELMRELAKVQRVTINRSKPPVKTILVMDATTGQNGLNQAREFNAELGIDGLILTKLDGSARGGVLVAIAEKFSLPVVAIGVGETAEDLAAFDPQQFADALLGLPPRA